MAQVTEIAVPDIGEFTDVPIIEILVGAGDDVAPEDPLLTLESDKATMDVPAPVAGVVEEILVTVGDTVSEGTPIMRLAVADDAGAPAEAAAPGAVEAAAEAEAQAPEAEAQAPEASAPPPPADGASTGGAPAHAGPGARRLARELGVDLAGLTSSGPRGRITREDVQAAAGRASSPDRARSPGGDGDGDGAGLGLAPWPQVDFARYGEVERVALSRIKRISGPNLARNWVRIPHVTHHDEADITDLEAFRKQLNAEQSRAKVTMVALLVTACVASLKAFPEVNASLDGDELVLRRYWNIGFATDTPQGLVVPVISAADTKGLLDVAAELSELSAAARDGKLKPTDMAGGTFTISSLGGIGGTGFTPIVNAPEVAILGVTRSSLKPVWDGERFAPRLMVPLSFSYDHRVIDGAAAARFCAHLVSVLEDLRRVLL